MVRLMLLKGFIAAITSVSFNSLVFIKGDK